MTTAMNAPAPDVHDQLTRASSVEIDPVVDIVVPVHNEEVDLAPSVRRLDSFLADDLPVLLLHHDRRQRQHRRHLVGGRRASRPSCLRSGPCTLIRKGRGRALKAVWSESSAPILAYMDVDLSTDLRALLPLVAPLISGHSDIAIGSRLARSQPGGARLQAGVHLAQLQPDPEGHPRGIVLRCPVRIQGHPRLGGRRPAAAGAGQQLVLRHRTPGDRPAGGPADPRGAGGLDRRPGQPGRHRRHREGGPGRRGPVDQGLRHRRHPGGPAAGRAGPRLRRSVRRSRGAARPVRPVDPLRRRRRAQHARVLRALPRDCARSAGLRRPT